jgi:ubiquinone/menaquinone biosynthesis C-methylase UbiE
MVANLIVIVAEELAEELEIVAGERVLDVACGSGNTAIAAARRLCDVTGVDYVPALLERGRARAAAEGLPVEFKEGDAEALPAPDGAYDVVLSTFGVMFAPNQEQAARELLRVCRPGGRIGLASWTPEGWIGEMFRITGRHVPPPAGLRPTIRWGTVDGLRELFGDGIASLRATRQVFLWRFTSAQQYLDLFRTYYGPTFKAFEALDEPSRQALARDLIDAAERFNRSDDGTLLVPAEYLEVVATKPIVRW